MPRGPHRSPGQLGHVARDAPARGEPLDHERVAHRRSRPRLLRRQLPGGRLPATGSVTLAIPAALFEVHTVTLSWQLVLAFAYTTLVPGLAATWLWFVLVSRIGPVRAATFHFLNPFFGVAVAAALLGEKLEVWDIVGVVIIAAGILAVQLSKAPKPV